MGSALKKSTPSENNLETSALVWLDSTANKLQESIDAQHQLRSIINHLEIFEFENDCEQYIKSLSELDRIILIVSGALGQNIVGRIHQYRQIVSIYVYCGNRQKHEGWTKQYPKIRGLVVQLDELISKIQSDQVEQQHNKVNEPLIFTTYNTSNSDEQLTSGLNGQFVHSQLLIDCLLQIQFTSTDKNELIAICKQQYEGNDDQLVLIQRFENEYKSNQALRWYTRDSFIYRMLNKALRAQNIHLIFLYRFLIRDLEKQLKDHQCSSRLTVYRGQLMSTKEFENLKKKPIGELISMNSFLSTSLSRPLAYSFLPQSTDLERVLFEIDANPEIHGIKPFANIASLSYYPKEEEVLFMLGSIFRLVDLSHDRNGVWTIKLSLCSDQDLDLKEILNHMKSQNTEENIKLIKLGDILRQMGKYDEAEKYYHRCLNKLSSDDDRNISICYYALGRLADCKGDLDQSLEWFQKSLEIDMRILKPDDPSIANTHNSMANIYQTNGDYQQALKSYNKALKIFRQALGEGDPHVAMCLNNIGAIYQREKNYSEALNYYQNALTIRQKHLPSNHYDIGGSYNNIGIIYRHLGQSDQALDQYNLALGIYKVSLPPQHPDIAMTLENIGIVYEEKRNWNQALSYYKKAEEIYDAILSPTHSDVVQIKKNIERVSSKLS
ncbi:unnamed protein product [Adineta steineri]|uniref:Kinesin light chain n=1 Tax=Adineta steineri TaxID=433720 RepID=A0A815BHW0_9BILA|nr:unnamed protein product [Adineta steineri]